jgi:hypothetical protein
MSPWKSASTSNNSDEPVDLYEVVAAGQANWDDSQQVYEAALQAFESGEFAVAARTISSLIERHGRNDPGLRLLSGAANFLVEQPVDFDPVWELLGK